jgi:hypothetical protein
MSEDESMFASLASYDRWLCELMTRKAKLVVEEMLAISKELNALSPRDTPADSDGDDGA